MFIYNITVFISIFYHSFSYLYRLISDTNKRIIYYDLIDAMLTNINYMQHCLNDINQINQVDNNIQNILNQLKENVNQLKNNKIEINDSDTSDNSDESDESDNSDDSELSESSNELEEIINNEELEIKNSVKIKYKLLFIRFCLTYGFPIVKF